MNVTDRKMTVRFQVPGFHRTPEATGARDYLTHPHRHLFHVELTVDLDHDDTDIQLHDLLDVARVSLGTIESDGAARAFGHASCEQLALLVIAFVADVYPGRSWRCSVLEDGEAGATMEVTS